VFTGLGNVVQVWHEFGLGASQNQLRLRNCPNVITLLKRVYSDSEVRSISPSPYKSILIGKLSVWLFLRNFTVSFYTCSGKLQRFARTLWPSSWEFSVERSSARPTEYEAVRKKNSPTVAVRLFFPAVEQYKDGTARLPRGCGYISSRSVYFSTKSVSDPRPTIACNINATATQHT
jgi:hypothetical protein